MRSFKAPDGTRWGVEFRAPGASNIMVVFHHPDASSTRLNRYAWINWRGAESRDVAARLEKEQVHDAVNDAEIARLFRRSMPIARPSLIVRNPAVESHAG